MKVLLLLMGLGCRHAQPVEASGSVTASERLNSTHSPESDPKAEAKEPVWTGTVEGGLFLDDHLDFLIEVPDGWEVYAGPGDGNLRVAMTEAQTGLRVEVWAFGGLAFEPRPRGDCKWTFQDVGGYRVLRLPDPVVVATCVPHEPADPRVFGYLVTRDGWTWQLEVHVPSSATLDSLHRGEATLRTARWGTRNQP